MEIEGDTDIGNIVDHIGKQVFSGCLGSGIGIVDIVEVVDIEVEYVGVEFDDIDIEYVDVEAGVDGMAMDFGILVA